MTVETIITAAEFFAAKLSYETDPTDLAASRAAGAGPAVIDTRSSAGWAQGRIPGAIHIPGPELADRAPAVLPDRDAHIVVYCWGPGCNGSTRAALTLASLGYRHVKELIGGFEYWAREGLAIETDAGRTRRPVDELAGPVPAAV
jgi:rhodanese-related sulfurtransferase